MIHSEPWYKEAIGEDRSISEMVQKAKHGDLSFIGEALRKAARLNQPMLLRDIYDEIYPDLGLERAQEMYQRCEAAIEDFSVMGFTRHQNPNVAMIERALRSVQGKAWEVQQNLDNMIITERPGRFALPVGPEGEEEYLRKLWEETPKIMRLAISLYDDFYPHYQRWAELMGWST